MYCTYPEIVAVSRSGPGNGHGNVQIVIGCRGHPVLNHRVPDTVFIKKFISGYQHTSLNMFYIIMIVSVVE
jgi:hypothetical protein